MLVAWPLLCEPANAQTPGQNVNMVSGLKWPGGDPFLQRQNEPSLAVSSRNERHLLAGANDYRSVDVPFPDVIPGPMAGDAWLGVFKSFDGGQTWQSTLLPGYPQDASPEGLASPLHGFTTAADPTVRAGTHGLFYYSGIAFNRGTNQGVVFVARFMDLANKENGDVPESTDPIKYLGAVAVDSGTSGQFIDKPWLAVDIPRAGAPTCMIPVSPTQSIPAGMAYLVWSRFTGSSSTKIMISHSHDCGTTWSTPIKLSESNAVNQGTVAAVDPVSGAVYVAWRRFASSSEPNAIVSVKSTNFGKTFTKATEVATIVPFDQGTTSGSFRTNALPTMAVSVDSSGQSRVHIAWADRGVPDGDARIRMTTSTDGLNWPAPVVVDGGPISDDADNSFTRGHQFMPALTFTGGKLMLLYYDSRLDHTVSLFRPNDGTIVPGCEFFCPDAQGDFYQVYQDPRGELPANPELVFTPFITDAGLNLRRHTLELRVAQSDPGNAPNFNYAMVSQYRFGTIPGQVENYLQQLQVEPPNFPMFQNGSVPFIGDYIDIAGQMFLPNPDGTWRFNTAPQTAPVHYAVWTSNRDVRPPTDGNWAAWTPPIYPFGGPMSIFDPSQPRPTCSMNREGMRNQNIYSSRITQGLVVTVPQNAKPLSPALKRAFVVLVKNDTNLEKHFRLAIANQPPGGHASFLPDNDSIHELDVSVAAHSGISRTVLATSSNPAAQITVNVNETFAPYGAINPSGLSSFVVLNGDATIPELVNPDGVDPNDPDQNIQNVEIYTPNISNPNISNPNISNPNISNPNISNPNISNPNISNPNISNPNISNPNISNPNISNPNISNPNISNPNISNTTLTDATYEVVNAGNTTTGYTVQLIGNTPTGSTLQLLVNRPYLTPVSVNCTVQQEVSYELLASVINPVINDPTQVQNPNLLDPRTTNATFWLRPGERALITLRGLLDCSTEEECRAAMTALTNQLGPDVVAQPQNEDNTHSFAMPLIITTNSPLDPSAKAGVLYSKTLAAFGGKPGYTWSLVSAVPDGLTLDANTGVISGTPLEAGDFTFTVKVVDSGTPQRETEKEFTLTVSKSATTTVVLSTAPNPSVVGEMVTVNYSVTINAPGSGTPTGTVNVSDGEGDTCSNPASAGSCAITLTSAGPKILTATFQANSAFEESSATTTHDVNAASTTTTITSNLSAATVVGQPYNVSVTVTPNAPGRGTPTGAVTVSDGAETCAITLAGGAGSCSLTSTTAGTKNVTAAYAGSADFSASTSAGVSHPVNPAATTTTITSDLSAATVVGQAYSVAVTVATNAPGSGVPTGVVTVSDGAETCIITLAGGAGSCNLTSTTSGLKNVTAAYAGAADFNASTSAGVSHTVNPAATTTTITSDLSAATVVGEAYSVAVNVASNAPGSGTPTGAVMVSDGAETCTITLASGVGSCNLTSTTAGLKSVTATYDVGDADKNYDTSTSAAVSHPVNATQATVVINTAGLETTPTVVGEPITVSIGVNGVSGAPLPTGTLVVSLEDGSAEPCTAALVDGQASCSITPLSAGPLKVIVAVYDSSGDPNYLDASATVTHDVNPAATSLTITSTSPSPSVVGQAVTVSYELSVTPPATGTPTPTGTVTVNADGLSCSGPAPAGSCSITFSTTGTKSLTATYDLGDTDKNYLGSTSAAFSHDVQPGSTTTAITAVSPATSVTGQSITVSFSASVVAPANGTLAGTVTVNDGTGASCSATLATGSCTLAPTSAGTKTLTASFVPSGTNFTGSSGTASHTVGKAGTTTTIAGDTPDPSETGQAVTVSWNVTVASPGSGTPTGTVTVNATGGLSCTGAAPSGSCTITFNTAGAKAITATYNGDANYLASTSAETAHEVKKPPYAFNGFLTPLSTAGTFDSPSFSGTFNKGKAIPIKWQLKNASGNFVTSLSSLTRMEAVFNSDCVGAPDGASVLLYSPTSGATGGSTFRYDTGNNQFVFNWDTSSVSPTGAGCYTLVVRLDEGTVRATNVKLR